MASATQPSGPGAMDRCTSSVKRPERISRDDTFMFVDPSKNDWSIFMRVRFSICPPMKRLSSKPPKETAASSSGREPGDRGVWISSPSPKRDGSTPKRTRVGPSLSRAIHMLHANHGLPTMATLSPCFWRSSSGSQGDPGSWFDRPRRTTIRPRLLIL